MPPQPQNNAGAATLAALPPQQVIDRHLPTGIAIYGYNAESMRAFRAEGEAATRECCAKLLDVTRAELQLAAGELTAQEWRTCKAVLRLMQARIRGAA